MKPLQQRVFRRIWTAASHLPTPPAEGREGSNRAKQWFGGGLMRVLSEHRSRHAHTQAPSRTSLRLSDSPLTLRVGEVDGPRRGVVLIVVLVLVVMVALAGFGFLAAMSTEYEGARLNGSMLQARQTMASAESTLNWFAARSKKERDALGGSYHNPGLFRGRVVQPLAAIGAAQTATLPGIQDEQSLAMDFTDDRWRFSVVTMDIGQDQNPVLRFGVENESSKLHLANILRWDQATPGQGRIALMRLPGMTDAVADCILDWIDADNQPREFGAENDYYQTLDRPYSVANAVPQRITELLFVKGMTRRLLLGSQNSDPMAGGNQNLQQTEFSGVDGNENFASDPAAASRGWKHFLTVHSAERNSNQSGQPRIFLNSSDLKELGQKLTAVLPENQVRYILLGRVYALKVSAGAGVEPSAAPYSSSMVPAFSIASVADLIDSTIQIPAASGGMLVQSPFQSDSPDSSALMTTLFDHVTTDPESVIRGRINISTASETVLSTLPGMTPEFTSQIVTLRDSLEVLQGDSVAWLLSRHVLDVSTFRKMFPEITTGGDVFQCEIIVHRAIGGPMLRQNLIMDAASTPVRRLQWSNLTETKLKYSHKLLLPRLE